MGEHLHMQASQQELLYLKCHAVLGGTKQMDHALARNTAGTSATHDNPVLRINQHENAGAQSQAGVKDQA